LAKDSIDAFKTGEYEYIISARIKNETQTVKDKILSRNYENGNIVIIEKNKRRLIIFSCQPISWKDKV
jgi:hypothetical protein